MRLTHDLHARATTEQRDAVEAWGSKHDMNISDVVQAALARLIPDYPPRVRTAGHGPGMMRVGTADGQHWIDKEI